MILTVRALGILVLVNMGALWSGTGAISPLRSLVQLMNLTGLGAGCSDSEQVTAFPNWKKFPFGPPRDDAKLLTGSLAWTTRRSSGIMFLGFD